MNEAEIKHLIDFVEDKMFNAAKFNSALVDHVDEAAGRRDENVETALQHRALFAKGDAADDEAGGEALRGAIGVETLKHLKREFARRRQHQNAAFTLRRAAAVLRQMMKNRQRKSCGLAGACLGDAQQVATFEDHGDGAFLNRGRRSMAFARKRGEDRL